MKLVEPSLTDTVLANCARRIRESRYTPLVEELAKLPIGGERTAEMEPGDFWRTAIRSIRFAAKRRGVEIGVAKISEHKILITRVK